MPAHGYSRPRDGAGGIFEGHEPNYLFTLGKRIALCAIVARYARQQGEERVRDKGDATRRFADSPEWQPGLKK